MRRDPRYDILFEPMTIGPLKARNRFFQVPHCNGMGHRDTHALAAMRAMKAQGGWAVVSTEMAEIHPTSDVSPFTELRLWSDTDIPPLAHIANRIHEGGALAAIELCHSGGAASNLWTREPILGPSAGPVQGLWFDPRYARAMDLEDIRNIRRAHRAAALRAKQAGYDLIYVYAGHGIGIFQQFLSRATNHRTDSYGGSLENRARFLREVLEDTRDAVGDTCAIPLRLAVNEAGVASGLEASETRDIVGMLAELPDLWDFALSGWPDDSQTARFAEEGFQESFVAGLKALTTKPVVIVGRYTSPDAMVRIVKTGLTDFIGAARPSIADPFLPAKIESGRVDDIRECIGCNICVSGDYTMTPLRCTQNPTMGEEWRRGWHPEILKPAQSGKSILIIGAGPAGLEAAVSLGKRGYQVTVADSAREPGGRVARECRLPGLATWGRVRDWRMGQINQLANVSLYCESAMGADDVAAMAADAVVLATGATWRCDGVGRANAFPLPLGGPLFTPDDLLDGTLPPPGCLVALYDDDHYYMGGVLAELLVAHGCRVVFITPAPVASAFTRLTMEQHRIQARLLALGVEVKTGFSLVSSEPGKVHLANVWSGAAEVLEAESLLLVTSRVARTDLSQALQQASIAHTLIGDAFAPGAIVHAVYSGRQYAEGFDALPRDFLNLSFLRERDFDREIWR